MYRNRDGCSNPEYIFGFFTGWYAYIRLFNLYDDQKTVLKKTIFYNLFCAGYTFVMMAVIWGQMFVWLFDKNADFANFGHPMILYDPKISFIGWLVLMIFISPFLQLLTSAFATYLTLIFYRKK